MADVEAALGALDRIEGILRKRYHYPHPIFEHVAATRAALEEPVRTEPETVTTAADMGTDVANTTPEPESGTEGPSEKRPARRKARRTKK